MATVVGSGDYKYEAIPSWPKMPRYWTFGTASDVAVNSSDEVYVFSRGAHPLTVWDEDGSLITSWGEGVFSPVAHGVCVTPNDNVWLIDAQYHIATEHAPDGTLLRTLGRKLAPSAAYLGVPFNMPTGLAIAPNGELFVSDGYGGHRVHKFSADGELLLSWGREGPGPGEFANLHSVGVDSRGRVFICDRENNRIQIFDDQGNFLEQWTDVQAPGDIIFKDDVAYVVEQGGGCAVGIWTLEGDLITRWRGSEGAGRGTLEASHGICVDSHGTIYVAELTTAEGKGNRVSKFVRV